MILPSFMKIFDIFTSLQLASKEFIEGSVFGGRKPTRRGRRQLISARALRTPGYWFRAK
jgi:hypothetical protein